MKTEIEYTDGYEITKTPIKREKIIYIANDGSKWSKRSSAEHHEKSIKLHNRLDAWPQILLRGRLDEEGDEPEDVYYLVKTEKEAEELGDIMVKMHNIWHPGVPTKYPALIHYWMEIYNDKRDELIISYATREDALNILDILK